VNTAEALLDRCRKSGLTLAARGGQLEIRAPKGRLVPDLVAKLKARKAELLTRIADEEQAIRTWLAHLGETDAKIIAEVMDKCRTDAAALEYFTARADELQPVTQVSQQPTTVACATCQHFHRFEDHPHLRHCAVGEPEAVTGLWDSDRRLCRQHRGVPPKGA
jgi:hypothetical protein